jgi:hypothetical protein
MQKNWARRKKSSAMDRAFRKSSGVLNMQRANNGEI